MIRKTGSKLLTAALMAGALFSAPAMAADVENWSQFHSAINGTDTTINVNADITFGADTLNPIERDLSIIGNTAGRYLDGGHTDSANGYKGLTVDAGGKLNLSNIRMQNFANIKSGDAQGGAITNNGQMGTIGTGSTANGVALTLSGGTTLYRRAFPENVTVGGLLTPIGIAPAYPTTFSDGFAMLTGFEPAKVRTTNDTRTYAILCRGDLVRNEGGAISATNETGAISIIPGTTSSALFANNYAQSTSSDAQGGGLYNAGNITNIISTSGASNYVVATGVDTFLGEYPPGYEILVDDTTNNFRQALKERYIAVLTDATKNLVGGTSIVYNNATPSTTHAIFYPADMKIIVIGTSGTGKTLLSSGGGSSLDSNNEHGLGMYTAQAVLRESAVFGTVAEAFGLKYMGLPCEVENGTPADFQLGLISSYGTISGYNTGSVTGIDSLVGTMPGFIAFPNSTGSAAFSGNYAKSETGNAQGGGLYNAGNIKNIIGDFVSNYAKTGTTGGAETGDAMGGAVYNSASGTIEKIAGSFTNNNAVASNGNAYGGAIYNAGNMNITSNNSSSADRTSPLWGLLERGTLGSSNAPTQPGLIGITSLLPQTDGRGFAHLEGNTLVTEGVFSRTYYNYTLGGGKFFAVQTKGGTVFTAGDSAKGQVYLSLDGDPIGPAVQAYLGDALCVGGGKTLTIANGSALTSGGFINNHAKSENGNAYGGAIYNAGNMNITSNSSSSADGIPFLGTLSDKISAPKAQVYQPWRDNYYGVGVFSSRLAHIITEDENGSAAGRAFLFANGSALTSGGFINNHAESENGNAYGGAIYNDKIGDNKGSMTFNGTTVFAGNYAKSEKGDDYAKGGAIYNKGDMTFNGSTIFSGNKANDNLNDIYNEEGGTITFNGDVTFAGDSSSAGNVITVIKSDVQDPVAYLNSTDAIGMGTAILVNPLLADNKAYPTHGLIQISEFGSKATDLLGFGSLVGSIGLVTARSNNLLTAQGLGLVLADNISSNAEVTSLNSENRIYNDGTINFNGITTLDGGIKGNKGTTNINGLFSAKGDITQKILNVNNGAVLSLMDWTGENTINTANVETFTIADNARLYIDVDADTTGEGGYLLSDRIIANTITNNNVGIGYINLFNIPNDLVDGQFGTIKLFDGTGVTDALNINNYATIAEDGKTAYLFKQHDTNKGDLTVSRATVDWKLANVVEMNTPVVGGTTTKYEVPVYNMLNDETVDGAITLQKSDGLNSRIFTLNGNGKTLSGINNAGITITKGEIFNLNDIIMTDFDITNQSGATTNITNAIAENIANEGDLNISGINSIDEISGMGKTYINGIAVINNDLTQKDLSIGTDGALLVEAKRLNISQDIENNGGLILGSGTLSSNINGVGSVVIASGSEVINADKTINNGYLEVIDTAKFTNNSTIKVDEFVNGGEFTNTNKLEAVSVENYNKITNSGNIISQGILNAGEIVNNGTIKAVTDNAIANNAIQFPHGGGIKVYDPDAAVTWGSSATHSAVVSGGAIFLQGYGDDRIAEIRGVDTRITGSTAGESSVMPIFIPRPVLPVNPIVDDGISNNSSQLAIVDTTDSIVNLGSITNNAGGSIETGYLNNSGIIINNTGANIKAGSIVNEYGILNNGNITSQGILNTGEIANNGTIKAVTDNAVANGYFQRGLIDPSITDGLAFGHNLELFASDLVDRLHSRLAIGARKVVGGEAGEVSTVDSAKVAGGGLYLIFDDEDKAQGIRISAGEAFAIAVDDEDTIRPISRETVPDKYGNGISNNSSQFAIVDTTDSIVNLGLITNNAGGSIETVYLDNLNTITNKGSIDAIEIDNSGIITNNENAKISAPILVNDNQITNNGEIDSALVFNEGNFINNGKLDVTSFVANEGSVFKGTLNGKGFISNGNNDFTGTLTTENLYLQKGMLQMHSVLSATNTFADGGGLNLSNDSYGVANLGNLHLNANMPLVLDVDYTTGISDQIKATSVSGAGKINMALVPKSNAILTNPNIIINPIANEPGAVRSALAHAIEFQGQGQTVTTPIFNYRTNYDPETGLMSLATASGGSGDYEDVNPAIMAAPVAAQMGGYLNLLNSYDDAFASMDMTMLMTKAERTAMKMRNKYAAADEANLVTFNPNQLPEENAGVWFRPYASFEKVNLNNGPDVGNNSYGGLVGFDSKMYELKHGWDAIYTGYAGYNGSHQHYEGNSIWQNGGQLGATAIFYKGDFFTGLTATAGASVGEATTMFGREDFTMLMAGVANKTGYNWELFNGKFIVQPSMLMSYSFVNTFDYNNAAGVRITSDPLHAIQLAPGLKFIGNLPHGWQPYIGMQMVWNIMDKTRYSANDVSLPETSIDPYFQYGVGLQKRWGERFTGYGQVMMRNGGRTGISLSGGFRWALGNNGKKMSGTQGVQKSQERNISLSVK